MNKKETIVDGKLVLDYQSGNQKALAILVKRWHLQFCKKAYWIVKDADLSKDIAQDSWTTIIYKMNTLKDVNRFGSWALRIVYSKSLDTLRSKSKERINQQKFVKDEAALIEDYKENDQLKNKLLEAIQNLPNQQNAVVKLFYLQDYSLKEISKTLNISVGTVKSRLFHAREKLKQILKQKYYENA